MKNMKSKKILITIIFSVICVSVILAVILIANNRRGDPGEDADANTIQLFSSLEEAVERAGFPLQCTDRLNGILATEYFADETVITVTYGKAGYITKKLIAVDESDTGATTEKTSEINDETTEEVRTEHKINGVTVIFTGKESSVTKAEWTDNGYDYAIVLTNNSVTADMMTDYVSMTR